MFKEIIPKDCLVPNEYITFNKYGYLALNSQVVKNVDEMFGSPEKVNLYVDEEEQILRMEFVPDGKFTITVSNGRSFSISFKAGIHMGIVPKRYEDIKWREKNKCLDMRYEKCKKEAEQE